MQSRYDTMLKMNKDCDVNATTSQNNSLLVFSLHIASYTDLVYLGNQLFTSYLIIPFYS